MICYCGQPCLKPPTGRPPVYCSAECREALRWAYDHNARYGRTCKGCGGPLDVRRVEFCNRACQQKAWYDRAKQSATWKEMRRVQIRAWQQRQRST